MTTKITAPVKQEGSVSTNFGPHAVTFENGVATVDFEITEGLKAYLLTNGYGVGSTAPVEPAPAPEPPDPRTEGNVDVSTPLRDAAVDPEPGDFLAPTNAGGANPHGPEVVSPGIHANQGVRPIKGGPVHADDTDAQNDSETEHAAAATDGTPVTLTAEEADLLGVQLADDAGTSEIPDAELKGEALDAKLEELGLSKAGTADERRERVRIATTPASELKGADLEAALVDADLPRTGSADERRARVQEHRDGQAV